MVFVAKQSLVNIYDLIMTSTGTEYRCTIRSRPLMIQHPKWSKVVTLLCLRAEKGFYCGNSLLAVVSSILAFKSQVS